MIADKTLLFTRCATSNASRHFKSPLAMGRDAFKSKRASSVSISGVIDTGVNSNLLFPDHHFCILLTTYYLLLRKYHIVRKLSSYYYYFD